MDGEIFFLLVPLAIIAGWVLGIRGYVLAKRAQGDLARLRAAMAAAGIAVPDTAPLPFPAPPRPAPEPEAEPEFAPRPAAAASPWPGPPPPAEAEVPPAEDPMPPPPAPKPDRNIEELLTARWGVWLGAGALLLAVVFLIRYAVEEGYFGPEARTLAAVVLGLALVAGAEFLHRRPAAAGPMPDYAPGALAAGGAASLFGAAYAAASLYALVPPGIGFALMAGAAMAGLALSLRYGPLAAAVGVAGAFATPALVSSTEPDAVLLFAYLFAVTAAAMAVVRYTAWAWLGWSATVAGALWVAMAAAGGVAPEPAAIFVPAAAALNLLLLPGAALDHPVGRQLAWVPFAALGFAGLLLGLTGGEAGGWGVLAMSLPALWVGRTEPRLDRLPWLAAGLGLLALLVWQMPGQSFLPPPETVTVEGVVQAVLPGPWIADAARPFIAAALLLAAAHALMGLWQERVGVRPLRWTALTAAVPVLVLAVAYARARPLAVDPVWAAIAVLLAGALVLAARAANDVQRAGAHAAGAVAAIALGFAMLLSDHWLTLAIALMLPALAWIEAKANLRPLRHVALAVAALVLIRLLANWYVLDYPLGRMPVVNGLLLAYGVPAACFALAAILFRRRGDDVLVAVLEAGAVAFAAALVALEIRHWSTGGSFDDRRMSFLESGLQVTALFAQAVAVRYLAHRPGRQVLSVAWRVLALGGVIGLVLLIADNPLVADHPIGTWPVLNPLLPAYALPALALAWLARTEEAAKLPRLPAWLGGLALIAAFLWVTLEVRRAFHPYAMGLDAAGFDDAELWAYSGAWLAFGIALMAAGIRFGVAPLRLAAIAVVGLTAAKAVLVDMGDLVGLWRVLSFLGLGLTLIALGAAYRRFVPSPSAGKGATT